jgi:integrase
VAIMAQPWKHPQNGIFYFRREVPEDIRRVIGKREWKVSLKTRHLPEARLRFIGEAQRCEEAFTAARDQLAGISRVLPSDAIKLADRWAKAVLQEWETNPEKVNDFLAVSDTGSDLDYLPASDFVGMDTPVALTEALSGFIRHTLHQLNLPLPVPADPARRALEDAFYIRWCELCRLAFARHHGDWLSNLSLPAAEQPLTIERSAQQKDQHSPKLSEVFTLWADDKRQLDGDNPSTAKTISTFGATIAIFTELFGDMPVSRITRPMCQEFSSKLAKMPTKGEGTRGLSAPQLIAKAEAEGLPTASLVTVKNRLKSFSAVLAVACRLGYIQENPVTAAGLIQRVARAAQKTQGIEDKGYSQAELVTIFTSPLFTTGWKPARADVGEALYWLPLLMAYTGARREELAQLEVADVRKDDDLGIWYLSIAPGEDKSVKTQSSRRKIPLHKDLLALGFLEYKDSLPQQGRLFPKLEKHRQDGYGHSFGKLWSKYLKDVAKLDSQASPSHGFRHTFKTLCREVGIETAVSDWITGHAAPNVGATYGSNPLRRMANELEKFPSLAKAAGLLPQ